MDVRHLLQQEGQKLETIQNISESEVEIFKRKLETDTLSMAWYGIENILSRSNLLEEYHTDRTIQKHHLPGCHLKLYQYNNIKYIYYMKYNYSIGNGAIEARYYVITAQGNLSKLILASRRLNIKPIFLPEKTFSLIKQKTIKYVKLINKSNFLPNSGIILYGPPGNGKSMIMNWLMNKTSFTKVSNESILGRKIPSFNDSTIYGLDDIDISFFSRSGKHSEEASYMLNFMDGETKKSNVYVLTTNEDVDIIDKAFLRPGRFDTVICIDKPTADLRKKFVESWSINIDVSKLVEKSDNWSFAELGFIRTCLIVQDLNKEQISLDKALAEFTNRQEEEKRYLGFAKPSRR